MSHHSRHNWVGYDKLLFHERAANARVYFEFRGFSNDSEINSSKHSHNSICSERQMQWILHVNLSTKLKCVPAHAMKARRAKWDTVPLILTITPRKNPPPVPVKQKVGLAAKAVCEFWKSLSANWFIRTPNRPALRLDNIRTETSRLSHLENKECTFPSSAFLHHCWRHLLHNNKLHLACNMQATKSWHEKQASVVTNPTSE
jgi:hypothetical protein